MARPITDARQRFERFVKPASNGCHEWQSTLNYFGYGKFYFKGRQVHAHRVAYLLYRGEIPVDRWVLHSCDNPKCVNPDHLYLGTPKDNSQDRDRRHRSPRIIKYDFRIIDLCKALYAGGMSQTAIAHQLGMAQPSVSRFILGQHSIR